MSQILEVNLNTRHGPGYWLSRIVISAMQLMIEQTENKFGKNSTQAENKIKQIKEHQLLGVELDASMFTLAATNMILRGDGGSNIQKGSSALTGRQNCTKISKPTSSSSIHRLVSTKTVCHYRFEMRHDTRRSGGNHYPGQRWQRQDRESNQAILRQNQLIASIKMPVDLFMPMAGVQTSIYIIEHTGKPHDHEKQVRFIDFSKRRPYKRTKRGISEVDHPVERYQDIVQIFKSGRDAKVHDHLWDLDKVVAVDRSI